MLSFASGIVISVSTIRLNLLQGLLCLLLPFYVFYYSISRYGKNEGKLLPGMLWGGFIVFIAFQLAGWAIR
jgi:hypothetical protein